jgi:hypothetical protein
MSDVISKAIELLQVASCPCCDGSGAYYDNHGGVCQCQFCYERKQAIDALQAPQPVVPEVRVLSRDEARLALWRAIQEVVVGNPTDDKLILENLYRSGVWLCLLSAGKGGE